MGSRKKMKVATSLLIQVGSTPTYPFTLQPVQVSNRPGPAFKQVWCWPCRVFSVTPVNLRSGRPFFQGVTMEPTEQEIAEQTARGLSEDQRQESRDFWVEEDKENSDAQPTG